MLWAVSEFKHYVGLTSFTIITDHRPLLGLRRMSIDNDPSGWRCRWILELGHRTPRGVCHANADALSSRPVSTHAREDDNVTYANAVDSRDVPDHPGTFHTQCIFQDDFLTFLPIGQSQPTVDQLVDLGSGYDLSSAGFDLQALQQSD